jgi:Ca2+-binding EF-hand superfamily protein
MIAKRLFDVFDKNFDGYLSSEEFINNLLLFYSNDFVTKLRLVFSLYDFDGDKFITQEDVKLILSYVPIKSAGRVKKEEGRFTCEGGGREEYTDRVQSQCELEALLSIYFRDQEKLNFEDFCSMVKEKASEIFICVYSVLRSNLPSLAGLKRAQVGVKKKSSSVLRIGRKGEKVAFATTLDKFTPTSELVKRSKQHFFGTSRLRDHSAARDSTSDEDNINKGTFYCQCGQYIEDFYRRLCKNCLLKRKGTRIEGYLIKLTRSKSKLEKFWIAIEHKEIYCYASKSRSKYKCVHSLLDCIIKKEAPEVKGKLTLYPFSLRFSNKKVKKYYAMSKSHLEKWLYTLKKNTNYADIKNYYTFKVLFSSNS